MSKNVLEGRCHCGQCGWKLKGDPGTITACNCTICSRYGALWAYDFDGDRTQIFGMTTSYSRIGKTDPALENLFCPTCGCVVAYRGLRTEANGKFRVVVNVRMAELEKVASLTIDHFDGYDSFEDLPSDGKCVRDLWA
jgi:hypothetical protein